jgi:hypothetical protein
VSTASLATPIDDPGLVVAVVLDAAVEGDCVAIDSADMDPLAHAARVIVPAAHRAATVMNLVGTVRMRTGFWPSIVDSWSGG